ncbi:MAG: PaREP1 family protein [Caldivirga sp.]
MMNLAQLQAQPQPAPAMQPPQGAPAQPITPPQTILTTPQPSLISNQAGTVTLNVFPPPSGTVGEDVFEVYSEYPELLLLAGKLSRGEELNEVDRVWLKELAKVSGWDVDDVGDELRNLWANPSSRVNKYWELFNKYYKEAHSHYNNKDYPQAAEKLWGAITALIKLHAALKGVPIIEWSHGGLYNYVSNNVEKENKQAFIDLLGAGEPLHRYFYELHLEPKAFEDVWNNAINRLETTKNIVLSLMARRGQDS